MFDEDVGVKEEYVSGLVCAIKDLTAQAREISEAKKLVMNELMEVMQHKVGTSKTYTAGEYKFSLKSYVDYIVDAAVYESIKDSIPEKYNPVKEVVQYKVDKKKLDAALIYADDAIKSSFDTLIIKRVGAQSLEVK